MKGIILAGGKGTRLWPATEATNKHLVTVSNLPMIEYPLYTLSQLNIDSISVVTGGEHFQAISQYLSKLHPDINFSYHNQVEAGGIAQALSLTEPYVRGDKLAVILGDNVFEEDFSCNAHLFETSDLGAMLFLKPVEDPKRFGIAEISDNRIISLEEKPKQPKSNFAATGLYFYDPTVFDKIKKIKASDRGELEITDVNKLYLEEGRLGHYVVEGFWSDAGTHQSRAHCEVYLKHNDLERRIAEHSLGQKIWPPQ
jgi:glucose-1-phosphate thymidylyltransferase